MLTPEDEEKEKLYLKKVIDVLNEEIGKFDEQVKFYSNNIQEQMSYAWDKTNRLSDTEFVYALANIQKRSVYAGNANKKIRNYRQMLDSAYFARIDFFDNESGEIWPIYIGIASLSQGDEFYVYDWRAPVASMFYNYEIGDASYEIMSGEKIKGKITLKRQFKIEGSEIKEVFDTELQIIDSILKKILSSNASSKMKNIVKTIQKEQNEIIRKNNADIFVIQGPAGSGKTSIAMHKIAYLLYAERERINNTNILILSPNEIFNNYISDVLPGIGEDNVVQGTFVDFAKNYITEFNICTKVEDVYEVVYASKEQRDAAKFNEIKFKYDDIYTRIIDRFISSHRFEMLELDDIYVNDKKVLGSEEMADIAKFVPIREDSVYLWGKRVIEKIYQKAYMICKKQLTTEKLKKQAIDSLSKIKLKISQFFKMIFATKEDFIALSRAELKKCDRSENEYDLESIYELTKQNLDEDKLEFQDVTPFMYFKAKLIGISPNKNLMYVLIDEAQDYSLTQYRILSMLFKNSNMTILGDLNQSILPFNHYDDYEGIVGVLESQKQSPVTTRFELSKTYRSTYEINDFAKRIIGATDTYSQIDRHGDDVIIKKQDSYDIDEILRESVELKKSYNTIAIICKNIEEAELYNEKIKDLENNNTFRLVTKNDNVFVEDKIMIIPSYLSKGLEFDAVIISNAAENYYDETEKNLFYVVATRALHKLEIYYSGTLTKLIK